MADRITFPPQIDESGQLRVGGVRLGELRDGQLVIPDRYQRRCQARGTEDVPVDLVELVAEIIRYYQGVG